VEKILKGKIRAVIFDLDGVIVSTDECHYEAWKRMADEEGIYFDRTINERLRGVSRVESLEIILERAAKPYDEQQKLEMTDRKNNYYRELIQKLTPADILPGVMKFIGELDSRGIKTAIGSSSKNSPVILERIGLLNSFDAVVDGNHIKKSKPDPEVFLKAAQALGIPAEECLVVEDADAGVEAAVAAGMKVLGVGAAAENKSATYKAPSLSGISVDSVL
jgi:beta-phosphoglucomutase